MPTYAWQRADESSGTSIARVAAIGSGWRYQGAEVLATPDPVSCTFTVDVDGEHRPRRAIVRAFAASGSRAIDLTTDGWQWQVDGRHVPALDGATDLDVAATPLTNTIPIRRIGHLAVGEQAVLDVAWVDVPSLTVHAMQQTYMRLEPIDGLDAWQYGDDAHGTFTLTVDAEGVVVDYAGLATRVGSRPE